MRPVHGRAAPQNGSPRRKQLDFYMPPEAVAGAPFSWATADPRDYATRPPPRGLDIRGKIRVPKFSSK
jgi:hypothetical protein